MYHCKKWDEANEKEEAAEFDEKQMKCGLSRRSGLTFPTERLRDIVEVWMLHSSLGSNTFVRIVLEHLGEEIEANGIKSGYSVRQPSGRIDWDRCLK